MSHRLERLETRRLFNGIYTKTDSLFVQRVFGTEGDDHLILTLSERVLTGDSAGGTPFFGYTLTVTNADDPTQILPFLFIDGYPKQLRLYLRGGNDTVTMRTPDSIRTGPGASTRLYIDAGPGNDTVAGSPLDDRLLLGSGNDSVTGGGGDDSVVAGSGVDFILCGAGNDTIDAGGGRDRGLPGAGDNLVFGGMGDDRFYTDAKGTSRISGGPDNDTLFSGRASDEFIGDSGIDTVDYHRRRDDLFIDLSPLDLFGSEDVVRPDPDQPTDGDQPGRRNNGLFDDGRSTANEVLTGYFNGQSRPVTTKAYPVPAPENFAGSGGMERDVFLYVERAVGGGGDDVLIGSSLANTLDGGAGDDTIYAGAGQDDVYGNDGDDQLFTVDTRDAFPTVGEVRHANEDLLDGGAGRDFARFDSRDSRRINPNIESAERLRELTS